MDIQKGEKGTLQTLVVVQGYIFLTPRWNGMPNPNVECPLNTQILRLTPNLALVVLGTIKPQNS